MNQEAFGALTRAEIRIIFLKFGEFEKITHFGGLLIGRVYWESCHPSGVDCSSGLGWTRLFFGECGGMGGEKRDGGGGGGSVGRVGRVESGEWGVRSGVGRSVNL